MVEVVPPGTTEDHTNRWELSVSVSVSVSVAAAVSVSVSVLVSVSVSHTHLGKVLRPCLVNSPL